MVNLFVTATHTTTTTERHGLYGKVFSTTTATTSTLDRATISAPGLVSCSP
jgi:hypothetical protein